MKRIDWNTTRYLISWFCAIFTAFLYGAYIVLSQERLRTLEANEIVVANNAIRYCMSLLLIIAIITIIIDFIAKRDAIKIITEQAKVPHEEE